MMIISSSYNYNLLHSRCCYICSYFCRTMDKSFAHVAWAFIMLASSYYWCFSWDRRNMHWSRHHRLWWNQQQCLFGSLYNKVPPGDFGCACHDDGVRAAIELYIITFCTWDHRSYDYYVFHMRTFLNIQDATKCMYYSVMLAVVAVTN